MFFLCSFRIILSMVSDARFGHYLFFSGLMVTNSTFLFGWPPLLLLGIYADCLEP